MSDNLGAPIRMRAPAAPAGTAFMSLPVRAVGLPVGTSTIVYGPKGGAAVNVHVTGGYQPFTLTDEWLYFYQSPSGKIVTGTTSVAVRNTYSPFSLMLYNCAGSEHLFAGQGTLVRSTGGVLLNYGTKVPGPAAMPAWDIGGASPPSPCVAQSLTILSQTIAPLTTKLVKWSL